MPFTYSSCSNEVSTMSKLKVMCWDTTWGGYLQGVRFNNHEGQWEFARLHDTSV